MIKIKFDLNDELINIEPGFFYNATIENREYFKNIISFLYYDFIPECGFNIYNDSELVEPDDICYSITNILDLDLNTKKNMNALNKIVKKTYYENLKDDLNFLKEKVKSIVKKIALDLDISLSMNDEIKTDDLFKIMDIKFSDEKETFLERFLNYLYVISELQNKKIFFTLHLKEYFSSEEIRIIAKEINYHEIILINFETHEFQDKISCEKSIIIDKDCCFIR